MGLLSKIVSFSKNLTEPTNYSADELNRVYSIMNIRNSRLAGKGAIFKEAEKRYGVNALI